MVLEKIKTEYALFEPEGEVNSLQDVDHYAISLLDGFNDVISGINNEIKNNKLKITFGMAASAFLGGRSKLMCEARSSVLGLIDQLRTTEVYLKAVVSVISAANTANYGDVYKLLSFSMKRYKEKGSAGMDEFSSFFSQEEFRIRQIKPVEKVKDM